MSGFEADWLSLREPADRRARDGGLAQRAADYVKQTSGPVVDLGCGTGSTFRALDPLLPEDRKWIFVDDDPILLDRARLALSEQDRERVRIHEANLAQLSDGILSGASLVTASALFDLVSEAYIAEFAQVLRRHDLGLYSGLTVDGRIAWDETHELDEMIVAAFARDQKKDKGFGAGLGGDAAAALEDALRAEGFTVFGANSDWVLGTDDLRLQNAFHAGFAETARGQLDDSEIDEWLSFRSAAASRGSKLRVGHRDCLALPEG